MQPQQQPSHSFSLAPLIALINRFLHLPALTVLVFLRGDIGYRALNPIHFVCIGVLMAFSAAVAETSFPDARAVDVTIFAVVVFVFAMGQRAKRWREFMRGVPTHSYYIGTSRLAFGWLPQFLKRYRRMERIADPFFCIFLGVALLPISPALGCWIIIAGLSIRSTEEGVRIKELNTNLDMLDSLIAAQAHSENVQRYTESPNTRPPRPTPGIPTGLGADIQKHLKKYKNN